MKLIRVNSGSVGGVAGFQLLPPSRVTCTTPSSEPVQITCPFTGEGASVKIVAYVSTPVWSSVIGPPDGPIVDGS